MEQSDSRVEDVDSAIKAFNDKLDMSRRGDIGIGIRNNKKSSVDRTDEIVRSILTNTVGGDFNDDQTHKEVVRRGNLYGCGTHGVSKITKSVSKRQPSNAKMYKYKHDDWLSAEMKLWNSHHFKDLGVNRMENYSHAYISLPELQTLLKVALQTKFSTREVAALVGELHVTEVSLGETSINYKKLLIELKRLGNIVRTNEQQLLRMEHESQYRLRQKRGGNLEYQQLIEEPPHLDPTTLCGVLRVISAACQSRWATERKHFIQMLREVPTGTLEVEPLREFLGYNIGARVTQDEAAQLIRFINGSAGQPAPAVSIAALVKDLKLLALGRPCLMSPPDEGRYDVWRKTVAGVEQLLLERHGRKYDCGGSVGTTVEENRGVPAIVDDDAVSVSSLGSTTSSIHISHSTEIACKRRIPCKVYKGNIRPKALASHASVKTGQVVPLTEKNIASIAKDAENLSNGRYPSFAKMTSIANRSTESNVKFNDSVEYSRDVNMFTHNELQSEGSFSGHKLALPTPAGLREPASLRGCGSAVMRAKTPMYLVRPVNASDSLLGKSSSLVRTRLPSVSGTQSVSSLTSQGDASHTSGQSVKTKTSKARRRKTLRDRDDKVAHEIIRTELELAALDEKGLGLRFQLRPKVLGEFLRCYKHFTRMSMDEILLALWEEVQEQYGKGIEILGDGGVMINRQGFFRVVSHAVHALETADVHTLFSTLDPSRRGYAPCHLLHGLGVMIQLRQGTSAEAIARALLRGAVWEHLNSRENADPSIVSSLSTSNTIFYDQIKERKKRAESVVEAERSTSTTATTSSSSAAKGVTPRDIAAEMKRQREAEDDAMYKSYLPPSTVSACLRAVCTSPTAERSLSAQLQPLFKSSYSKNVRQRGLSDSGPAMSKSKSTKNLGNPLKVDYVLTQDVLDYIANDTVMSNILQEEHRATVKIVEYNMHKTKEREKL